MPSHRYFPACALVVALALAGGCSSSVPTAPTIVGAVASGVGAAYTASGIVVTRTAAGLMPVAGVRVEWGDPRVYEGGLWPFAVTDKDGAFSTPYLARGTNFVRSIKFGYETDRRNVVMNGDTRVEIELVARPTYTLSGMAFESTSAGLVALAGVDVYCDSCGDGGHISSITDASGAYSFPAVYSGVAPLIITKAGYRLLDAQRTLSGGFDVRDAIVAGHTRLDLQLVRR